MHRYRFDGRYAYISPTAEGYIGNIVMILDLKNPAKPAGGRALVDSRPVAGGRRGAIRGTTTATPRCHHPLRRGDRLYVSYWHHGIFILDISDMSKPKMVSQGIKSRAFPHPTHTCLPMPQKLKNRDMMIVADEDVAKLYPSSPSFTWIYDITDERTPIPISYLPGRRHRPGPRRRRR